MAEEARRHYAGVVQNQEIARGQQIDQAMKGVMGQRAIRPA
jgi:hypothetical protein